MTSEILTNIIIIVIIALAFALAYIKQGKVILKKAALYFVSVAEESWGDRTGKIKFAQVYQDLTTTHPWLTILLSEKIITDIIENALIEFKEIIKAI